MARPIPHLEDLGKLTDEIKPKESKSIIDLTVETIRNKSTKYFVLGTITVRPRPPSEEPKPAVIQKPEPYRPDEFEKPFLPSKPIPYPPKISPSSIPNPSPSVTANMETSYPSYGGFLYNIPGYSAFQPVNYSNSHSVPTPMQTNTPKPDFKPFTITGSREIKEPEEFERREENVFARREEREDVEKKEADTPKQQDFEENFTMKIIPTTSNADANNTQVVESKMSITSLAQGSGGSVTIPTQINKDTKKKSERYSLKTSIPISKIDMKCVSTPVDTAFQNANKKAVFNPAFQKEIERPKVEIQSNIVIKTATVSKESEVKDKPLTTDRESLKHNKPLIPSASLQNTSICTLINAADAINKNDNHFKVPEPKVDVPKEVKESPVVTQPGPILRPMFVPKDVSPLVPQPTVIRPIFNPATVEASKPITIQPSAVARPMFNPVSVEVSKSNPIQPSANPKPMFNPVSTESSKPNFSNKPPDGGFNEQKNVVFVQNQNPKMLLTIQPNPQVLLQRTNYESKNLQAPSRLSSQSNMSEVITDTSTNVVALKRLNRGNGDENDFENLIKANQIYGHKILVKEKSQTTQEEWKNKVKVEKHTEQDRKNKLKTDIKVDKPPETKNVVLQQNFVYLSNVQFPANVMVITNNTTICQTTDPSITNVSPNENRTTEVNTVNNNNLETNIIKNSKPHNLPINKEVEKPKLLKSSNTKSSNNKLQTLTNNNNKTDIVIQTSQKVIVTPQVVYQVPIVVTEVDNKNLVVKESKVKQKKEPPKQIEDKLEKTVITSQVETKVPKIVISNLKPKVTTEPNTINITNDINTKIIEEVSTLDIYENKKRLRRLKNHSNTNKEVTPKIDTNPTAMDTGCKVAVSAITPKNIKEDNCKEAAETNEKIEVDSSDSESDEEDELDEYNAIIEKFGENYNENAKADFLAGFNLASSEVFREKQLERHERTLKFDSIASAYIAAGRLDPHLETGHSPSPEPQGQLPPEEESKSTLQKKNKFLAHFKLMRVSQSYKTDYEKTWRKILRERNRRYGITNPEPFDPDDQLQMLTEINKSVDENNALIKKRLDSVGDENSDIRVLAEKNFSELNRLSKMADRSVKLFSGKDTKKRDLNPGFDSENIKKFKVDPKDHTNLNIPNISKIISPKTDQESCPISSSQATSMDEPSNSASCGEVMTKEVGCQAEEKVPWQVVTDVMDDFIKSYRKYEIARKKEMDDLIRNNTRLRVESAHVTRSASRDSDRAQALLAERQLLAGEEAKLRTSLERLNRAIEVVRTSFPTKISLHLPKWKCL